MASFDEVDSKINDNKNLTKKELSVDMPDNANLTVKKRDQSHNTTVSSSKNDEAEENIVTRCEVQNSDLNSQDLTLNSKNSIESPRHLEPLNFVCLK